MNHNDFFDAAKAGRIQNLYLFEGAEEYIKGQALVRLCGLLLPAGLEAMNLSELDNPDADVLIATAETLPFMGEKRMVVVRECDLLTTSKKTDEAKLEAIKAYLEKQSPSTCLVFTVKGKADARKSLYNALKKANAIVDFSPMGDNEAANWAVRTMRALGKRMDLTTAQKLIFTVGHDAALLKQEMEKLAGYTAERDEILEADIDAISVKSLECTVFQMVDAQVSGHYADAFTLMRSVLESGEDRFMVLAMLLRQYRILYHMSSLMEERTPQASLGTLLGIPPFAVSRTQAQAKRYPRARLKDAYDFLFDLEYRLKSGQAPQEGSAEAAMFKLDAILNGEKV